MEYPRIKELLQDDSYVNKRKGPPSAVTAAICGEKRNGGLFCSCREQSKRYTNPQLKLHKVPGI